LYSHTKEKKREKEKKEREREREKADLSTKLAGNGAVENHSNPHEGIPRMHIYLCPFT